MTIDDLIKIYETKKKKYGLQAYRHISNVLKEAKELHKKDFTGKDHEQSWRAFKGKNLEKLIEYIITDEVNALGLQVVNGNSLERTNGSNLSKELSIVKRNLLIDYGEFGSHLPDVDLIIYDPKNKQSCCCFIKQSNFAGKNCTNGILEN
jgi:type II restriction enzyme